MSRLRVRLANLACDFLILCNADRAMLDQVKVRLGLGSVLGKVS